MNKMMNNINIEEQNALPLKQRLFRIGVIYFIGFTIFFLAALTIITINVRTKQKLKVPSLVGKLYIEEHNALMNLGLKVDLEKANMIEYPYGYILAQNIAPGKIVKEGTHFVLLVNESRSVVPVPEVVGVSESIALKLLANIPVGKSSYSLTMGTITRISNERPAGEVLAQFPPPSTSVIPLTPVSVLISEGPEKLKTGFLMPDLKGVNIEIIKKMSYDLHIPIKIVPVKVYDYWRNGDIANIDYGKNGLYVNPSITNNEVWTLYVNRYVDQSEKIYPNSLVWINFETTKFKGKPVTVYEKTKTETVKYKNPAYMVMDESWPLYFSGEVRLVVWDGYHDRESLILTKEVKQEVKKISEPDESLRIDPDFERNIRGAKI